MDLILRPDWPEPGSRVAAYLGAIEIGALMDGKPPQWLCHLNARGFGMAFWKHERTLDRCEQALFAAVADWLKAAGLPPLTGIDRQPAKPRQEAPAIDLTEIGEQFVIPGCERDPAAGPEQGHLWDAPKELNR